MSDNKHDKAVDLAEKALEAAEKGDDAKAKKLADQANKTDPEAVEEVVEELEHDGRAKAEKE